MSWLEPIIRVRRALHACWACRRPPAGTPRAVASPVAVSAGGAVTMQRGGVRSWFLRAFFHRKGKDLTSTVYQFLYPCQEHTGLIATKGHRHREKNCIRKFFSLV